MRDPLPNRGKILSSLAINGQNLEKTIKNNQIFFTALMLMIVGSLVRVWDNQPIFYAHAYSGESSIAISSPLFEDSKSIFKVDVLQKKDSTFLVNNAISAYSEKKEKEDKLSQNLEKRINDVVENSPIKEMVPFIAQRDQLTAAFLIGIAKKESSFGAASPSKDGKNCYNYWGYKGAGERGIGMGYACFATPEEAVRVVGDRIAQLVAKERNTPQRMVDTWKCGVSCAGDKGAPSWVSTVALYFEKIVDRDV